jgi:hypothetical protein
MAATPAILNHPLDKKPHALEPVSVRLKLQLVPREGTLAAQCDRANLQDDQF